MARVDRDTIALYRATQHLDSYVLLTSKQKFPRLVGRYCSYLLPTQALSTFNLMSTEYRNQGAVSPFTCVPPHRFWPSFKVNYRKTVPGNGPEKAVMMILGFCCPAAAVRVLLCVRRPSNVLGEVCSRGLRRGSPSEGGFRCAVSRNHKTRRRKGFFQGKKSAMSKWVSLGEEKVVKTIFFEMRHP